MAAKAKLKAKKKPAGNPQAFAEAAECLKTLAHPVPDNVASEHLRLMQRCGFFTSEREGRRVYYQVAEPHLEQIMNCVESRFLPARR